MKFFKLTIYTFIFLLSLGSFNHVNAATEVVRTIKPSGQGGDYTSLAAWEAGEQKDLVVADEIAVAQIDGSWSAPDTTAVNINGWTTDATHYIKIHTTKQARHSGKWASDKYRLEYTTSATFQNNVHISEDYVRIEGIQFKINYSHANVATLSISTISATGNEIDISSSIFAGVALASNVIATGVQNVDNDTNLKIYNSIAYGFKDVNNANGIGFSTASASGGNRSHLYNCTTYNNYRGIADGQFQGLTAINNIAYNNTDNYYGTFDSDSNYNLSGPSQSDAPGSNPRNAQAVSFVDEAGDDFHLSSLDGSAKRNGVDLSADADLPFSTDIDGESRLTPWDIGADQLASNAYLQSTEQKENSLTDGLVLYQSFDGQNISGSTALDSSGLGNNGTISGATATIGKRGQGLDFSGTTNNVSVGSPTALDNLSTMTACAWIYPRTQTDDYPIIFSNYTGNGSSGWDFYLVGSAGFGSSFKSSGGYGVKEAADVIITNSWNYICALQNGDNAVNIKLYVNGDDIGGNPYSNGTRESVFSNPAYIGNEVGNTGSFVGKIDEVRIYNRALSPDEIGSLYRLGEQKINMSLINKNTTGLVGMWSFDGNDISGNTAYDRSGQGNNGTISGATPTIGKRGRALGFDGVNNQHVALGDINAVEGNAGLSVGAWVKFNTALIAENKMIVSKRRSGFQSTFHLIKNNALEKFSFQVWNATAEATAITDLNYQDTDWHYVVGVYDGNSVQVYVDGVAGDSTPPALTGNVNNSTYPICIGIESGNAVCQSTFELDGNIDEVRIYNRALSVDEIGDLYRLGQVRIKN